MTLPRRLAAVATVLVAATAADGLPRAVRPPAVAPARAAGDDIDALLAALDRVFAAAEADHAKARAKGFRETLGDFPEELRATFSAEAAETAKDVERVLRRIRPESRPLSDGSMRVVLARMLAPAPPDPVIRDADETARFLDAVAEVFADPRFEDCWDKWFRELPEVVAWRAAHAPRPAVPQDGAGPAPDDPPPKPADPAPGTAEATPVPTPPSPVPDLPTPFALDATVNLVPLDRARGWVGPWTGWIQEIPEKENRRQKRPAKAVWIDRYEVTCFDYLRFLRAEDAGKRRALLPVGWTLDERSDPACPAGRDRFPVTGVTFLQAQAYAAAVGKRLPTEDEWDRAAGGGEKDGRPYPWGATADDRRWAYAGGGSGGPVAVDEFPGDRTPDSIVGLAGNVAEMVASLPDRHDVPAKVGPTVQIVVRGGSFRTSREADCGTTFRWVLEAGQAAPHVGFRCVIDEAEYRRRFR